MQGKCRVLILHKYTYTRGIYYYKEQGYDSQQSPQCRNFIKAVNDPRYSPQGGGGGEVQAMLIDD